MIVVDTNVVVHVLIEGEQTGAARVLREVDPEWNVPTLWRHEFINVLSTYVRVGGMPTEDAVRLWRAASALMAGCEFDVDPAVALEVSITSGISAYDAQFVVLAQRLNTRLVTQDTKLLTAFPSLASALGAHP